MCECFYLSVNMTHSVDILEVFSYYLSRTFPVVLVAMLEFLELYYNSKKNPVNVIFP